MPEPKDNELYLLMCIKDVESTELEFVIRGNSDYSIVVGDTYDEELYQYSHDTVKGYERHIIKLSTVVFRYRLANRPTQVMIRISGKNLSEILFLRFNDCAILEIRGRLPKFEYMNCAYSKKLSYFMLEGENKIESTDCMFDHCKSLIAVLELDTKYVTDMSNMFYGCASLEAIPEMNTKNVKDMSCMFWGCYTLEKVPMLDTQNVVNMSAMFFNCFSLKEVPKLNTRSVKNMSHIFDERLDIEEPSEL